MSIGANIKYIFFFSNSVKPFNCDNAIRSNRSLIIYIYIYIYIYCFSIYLSNKKIFVRSSTMKPMAKKFMRKTMILVMELIILAIFQAQANVLTPPTLCPTSLPIRLLQSSQNGNARRHQCIESTI